MAAEKCVTCLIAAMDRLWFHQIVLFSEPSSPHFAESSKKPILPHNPSRNTSQNQESGLQDIEISSQESDDLDKETTQEELDRPTRSNLAIPSKRNRSQSSSPFSVQKQSRKHYNNLGYNYSSGRLKRTLSCKSLVELELEEVKGFMDLGFIFRKENLSKRMMSLIPGLQRLDYACKNQEIADNNSDDDFERDEKGLIMRPYLSEAWLIKRPDSPLLNLRIPARVSNAAHMKKHLKYWARTVASAIQQES